MHWDEYSLGDDAPKNNPWREDRLGYAPFARRLANIVINMRVPNGYVIGLHGRWGSGKTTVINFVLAFLAKHSQETEDPGSKVEHLDFRPWIVSGHQDLIAAFFKVLSESLGPKEGRFKHWWKRRLKFLSGTTDQLVDAAATLAITVDPSGGTVAGVAGTLAKNSVNGVLGRYLEDPSLQKAYEDLRLQLAASGRRFLVTIDDIDRLEDEEIRSIMQMVKTVGRLPNVFYILAYDRDIVWQALDEGSERVGPKFAEKIVQQEVELPQPSRNALFSILDQEIDFLVGSTANSTRWHYIVRDGVHRWIKYPRDVLRLSNALKFAWPALKGEFDPQDLVAVEGIRLFDPEAFDWIRSNRDFLFNDGRYLMGADEERKANVQALRSRLPEASSDTLIELLTVLFPAHGKWLQGDRFMTSESNVETQNRRGIASEAGYDSYFALRPSADAIPKSALDTIFSDAESEENLKQTLNQYLGKRNSRGTSMIGLLLESMRYRFAGEQAPLPKPALLNAVLSIADQVYRIPWRGEFFTLEPSSTLSFLVRDMLKAWGEADAGRSLIHAFDTCQSPFVLADIYVDRGRELGVFPYNGPSSPVISQADFDEIGSILLPKIRKGVEDKSIIDVPHYVDVIRSWAHLENADVVQDWLRNGIAGSARFTAKVIKGMVSQSGSDAGIRYTYQARVNETLYDEDFIYVYAKQYLVEARDLEADDQALLRALVVGVERIRAGKSPDTFLDE